MQLVSILDPARTRCGAEAASKKRVLEILSELLVQGTTDPVTPHAVFDCLVARERLGSTGLGHGVALPHARLSQADEPVGAFLKIERGVDFDAPDGGRVDLVFGLLVPEDSTEEHLEILSQLAALFHEEELRRKLREASTGEDAFEIIKQATHTPTG